MNTVVRNVIFIILTILMLWGFIYFGVKDYGDGEVHKNDNVLMTEIYSSLPKDNIYTVFSNKEMEKFLESGTGILLFCFKESLWCNSYVEILNRVAKEIDIKEIYYYDILRDREDESYYYQKVIDKTKEYLNKNDLDVHVLNVPDVYIINDGNILGHNNETSTTVGFVEPDTYWSDVKILEFEERLKTLLGILPR